MAQNDDRSTGWVRPFFRMFYDPIKDDKNEEFAKLLDVSQKIDERVERLERRIEEQATTSDDRHDEITGAIASISERLK